MKKQRSDFYETLTSYQKQLAESEEWIASHFADIDQSAQTNAQPFSRDRILQTTEEIEPILKTQRTSSNTSGTSRCSAA